MTDIVYSGQYPLTLGCSRGKYQKDMGPAYQEPRRRGFGDGPYADMTAEEERVAEEHYGRWAHPTGPAVSIFRSMFSQASHKRTVFEECADARFAIQQTRMLNKDDDSELVTIVFGTTSSELKPMFDPIYPIRKGDRRLFVEQKTKLVDIWINRYLDG